MGPSLTVSPGDAGELRERLKSLPDRAEVIFTAGVYPVGLWLEQSLTLAAVGGEVVLEGDGGPIIEVVNNPDAEISIEGLTLRGGRGKVAGLAIHTARKVTVKRCRFEDGDGEIGAVMVRAAEAELSACHLVGNAGSAAQAVIAYQGGRAVLVDCLVGGNRGEGAGVVVQGAGLMVLDHCTVVTSGPPAARVIGTGFDAPIFQARSSILGDPPLEVAQGGSPIANVTVKDCALSRPLPPGADDLGGNEVRELKLGPDLRGLPGAPSGAPGVRWSLLRAPFQ